MTLLAGSLPPSSFGLLAPAAVNPNGGIAETDYLKPTTMESGGEVLDVCVLSLDPYPGRPSWRSAGR
jgi:hypothetical protein